MIIEMISKYEEIEIDDDLFYLKDEEPLCYTIKNYSAAIDFYTNFGTDIVELKLYAIDPLFMRYSEADWFTVYSDWFPINHKIKKNKYYDPRISK